MNIDSYLKIIDTKIKEILERPEKNDLTFDLLDTEKSIKNKMIILKEKQKSMKIGEIWQEVIGNYYEFTNLKVGHKTGLDIISTSKKIIIELKNRTNTDNHSSRKTNYDKLAKFKKENPEYLCIYATINADTKKKTFDGAIIKIIHNNEEIYQYTGFKFLELIFEDNIEIILKYMKEAIDKYST